MSNIDSRSIIHNNAIIGKNVTIQAFVVIYDNVTIGDNTIIYNNTVILGKTTIGKNNHIYSHSVIGSVPQDLSYNGEEVELIIGDNNSIHEFVSISRGTKRGGSITKIGDNNLIMSHSHIGHDVNISNNCTISSYSGIAGHALIEDNVIIGGRSSIHQFVRIGSFSMISGLAGVGQDVPPFCLIVGVPGCLRSINTIGLQRHSSFKREDIKILKNLYKKLFIEPTKSIQDISKDIVNSIDSSIYEKKMAYFILNDSKRGFVKRKKKKYYE